MSLNTELITQFDFPHLTYNKIFNTHWRNRNKVSAIRKTIEVIENHKKVILQNKTLSQYTEETHKECVAAISDLWKTVNDLTKEVEGLDPKNTQFKKNLTEQIILLEKEYDVNLELENHQYYKFFKVKVIIPDIKIKFNGELFDIGNMLCSVIYGNTQEVTIRCSNLTKPRCGYPHPHIGSGGKPCLGDAQYIKKMVVDGNLYFFIKEFEQFLKSYNPQSPYLNVAFWKYDYCADCNELREDCYCEDEIDEDADYDDDFDEE